MASPVGHALVGIGLAAAVALATDTPSSSTLWIGTVVASNVPDLDFIGIIFGFAKRLTHRQATHSLLVLGSSALVAVWAWSLMPGGLEPGLGLAWSFALLAHPLLDVVTTGPTSAAKGSGIPLFWPVLSRRWFVQKPICPSVKFSAYLHPRQELWEGLLAEVCVLGPVPFVLALFTHLF